MTAAITAGVQEGELLFTPSAERIERSRLREFQRFLEREHGVPVGGYEELWRFSVADVRRFWQALARFFEVKWRETPTAVLEGRMPAARFFPGGTLNYAEHALAADPTLTAIVFRSEQGERQELTYGELAELVGRTRAGLVAAGVGRGDRVAAILPNRPETVALFLATASLGATFSSSAPEFGAGAILDRFRQIEPKLLIAVEGYQYGGRYFDRHEDLSRIARALPSLRKTVVLGARADERLPEGALPFAEFTSREGELSFEPVPFAHPLYILYSSGTTGLPKPIVHGHGGILLEHLKVLALHSDLGKGDRFFWFSTTGWMMWNYLVSGLLLGATIVLYDGSPAHPSLDALWKLAESERLNYFGTSAPFLIACQKAGLEPGATHDLSNLRAIGTTGAPLPPDGFSWVYQHVNKELELGSVSGGTDLCTAFVLSCPLLPVHAGELQCRGLGAKVEAFDEAGRSVVGEVGELVITEPMPSMPISLWGDADGSRLFESYFAHYPGVWRHGDWIKITERGSAVIYGRSDSTLNRGGVRMGTSEFYGVVEAMPEIADSLVIDTSSLGSNTPGKLWLFVVLAEGVRLDAALEKSLRTRVRSELSPRHVPDEIVAIAAVPRTLNGKKLEVPVKKILLGMPAERAAQRDTLANPDALVPFVELARRTGA